MVYRLLDVNLADDNVGEIEKKTIRMYGKKNRSAWPRA